MPNPLLQQSSTLLDLDDETSVLEAEIEEVLVKEMLRGVLQSLKPKEPQSTSKLSGIDKAEEIMVGSSKTFQDVARMPKDAFEQLRDALLENGGIEPSDRVSADMALLMFLDFVGQAATTATLRNSWQLSKATVHEHIGRIIPGILALQSDSIFFPEAEEVEKEIYSCPRRSRYFSKAIGAIDGTHLRLLVEESEAGKWRNKKSFLSTNVLAITGFGMCLQYIAVGSEGTVHDSTVHRICRGMGLEVPAGRYLLADAGYVLSRDTIIPYPKTRYHIKEWQLSEKGPQTMEELFNLRHAYTRNVVERVFGVIGRRFRIIGSPLSYPLQKQHDIISCCLVIHNIIRMCTTQHTRDTIDIQGVADIQRRNDESLAFDLHQVAQADAQRAIAGLPRRALPDAPVRTAAEEVEGSGAWIRANIARAMWRDYRLEMFKKEDAKDESDREAAMTRARRIAAARTV